MLRDATQVRSAAEIAALTHAQKKVEAARLVLDLFKVSAKISNEKAAVGVLTQWLHHCLNNGGASEAAQLLWTPNQFTPEPSTVKALWDFFDEISIGIVLSGGRLGKSYSLGARLFLEWIRDVEFTSVRVLGPSKAHLEGNLFSHLVSLHQGASLPMPGKIGSLFIGRDRRNQLGSIRGIVVPKGNTKKAGSLQGGHRKPRAELHPIYGLLSRMFILCDEFENIPAGIWHDINNALSEVEKDGGQGFKLIGCLNPSNISDECAKRSEPVTGWGNFDPDKDYRWKSARGWEVLRLDAEKTENVIQKKEVFAGLQTFEGAEAIARNGGGKNSAGYYTMVRGCYPPQGTELTLIPPGMLPKFRGEAIWYDNPKAVASCDLALEGGAKALFTLGKFGLATGVKYPISLEHPIGKTVMFKNSDGRVVPRHCVQADTQFVLQAGDTVKIKTQIIDTCKKSGVRPEFFCCDRTGAGAGIADLLKHEWSEAIQDVNYSMACSSTKIMAEDSHTCNELFDRVATELWFAVRAWGEFVYLLLNPSLDLTALGPQLTQRKVKTVGAKSKIEAKRDYTLRTGQPSPDEADSLTLFLHAVRKGSSVIPSMKGSDSSSEDDSEAWYDGEVGHKIDFTSRPDSLEDSIL